MVEIIETLGSGPLRFFLTFHDGVVTEDDRHETYRRRDLPASAWVGYVFLKHRKPAVGMGRLIGIIAVGMVINGALPLSINLYLHGVISRPFLDLLQLAIAGLIPIVGALLEPRPERISSTPELQHQLNFLEAGSFTKADIAIAG